MSFWGLLSGYHVTGSAGTLFLYGIVVGAVGLFGLSVLLADAPRAYAASRLLGDAPRSRQLTPDNGLLTRLRAFGHPSAAAADPQPDLVTPRKGTRCSP